MSNSEVTLYKAPQAHYDVDDIVCNGFPTSMFPGEGIFFTTDSKVAYKYAQAYKNGVHEIKVDRVEYDRLIREAKIVTDPWEPDSIIVRPHGIDEFNAATTARRHIHPLTQEFWDLFGMP